MDETNLGLVYKCASYLVLAALVALYHIDSIPEFLNDRMKIGRLFFLRPLFFATRPIMSLSFFHLSHYNLEKVARTPHPWGPAGQCFQHEKSVLLVS